MFSSLIVDGLEFLESRVHYTLSGIKSLLKIGEGVSVAREGGRGSGTPGTLPWLRPCHSTVYSVEWTSIFSSRVRLVLLDKSHYTGSCPHKQLWGQDHIVTAVSLRFWETVNLPTSLQTQHFVPKQEIRDHCFQIYQNSYLSPRLEAIKQKRISIIIEALYDFFCFISSNLTAIMNFHISEYWSISVGLVSGQFHYRILIPAYFWPIESVNQSQWSYHSNKTSQQYSHDQIAWLKKKNKKQNKTALKPHTSAEETSAFTSFCVSK